MTHARAKYIVVSSLGGGDVSVTEHTTRRDAAEMARACRDEGGLTARVYSAAEAERLGITAKRVVA